MKLLVDAAWRAAAYCLHPLVIALSLLPLLLIGGLAWLLGALYWEQAIDAVRAAFDGWGLLDALFKWLESIGMTGLKTALAPLVVVFLATPLLVVMSLLAVAVLMAPAMLKLVARRRFPALEQRRGGSFAGSVVVSLGATVLALVALLVSVPFWLVPPMALVLPPLIWGWLTYRVMTYDMLADHASHDERRELVRRHRWVLLAMGVITGYLGAAPSLVWVSGVVFVVLAPLLLPVAIWIYTLVFAYSALWFAHYLLAALDVQRAQEQAARVQVAVVAATPESLEPPQPPGT